jgi:hypothetical protein
MSRRRRWLTVLLSVAACIAAVAFAAGQGAAVRRLATGVAEIDPAIACLGLVVSAMAITNRGLLNQASHRAVGLDARLSGITRTAAVGFAAQKLVKTGGMIGLTVFVRHGRRRGHAAASVIAACALTAAASFAALGLLLASTLVVLAATGRLEGWWIAAAIGFGLYSASIGVAAFLLVRSRRLAEVWWARAQRVAGRFARVVRPSSRPSPERCLPAELFDAFGAARHRPHAVRRLLAHAVASKALGALMLATAVAAVGLPISLVGILVVYAGALSASMLSIVPAGLGAVEGSTAALLIASGASAGSAALAVALFRMFDLWAPVVVGAVASHGELCELEQPDGVARVPSDDVGGNIVPPARGTLVPIAA